MRSRSSCVAAILAKATELTGESGKALAWFRHQPLDAFGGRTAEQMVAAGEGKAVLLHLRALAEGAYA